MSARASMDAGKRWALFGQVTLASLLAVAAAVLATEVADWKYWRVDLSAQGRNTIDEATLTRVDNLDGDLQIDTFLRPLAFPYDSVSGEALARVVDLLFQVENARRDKVRVVHHDMSDPATVVEAQRGLGVEGENLFVVSYGDRRSVVRVFGEAVAIDWGNPTEDGVRYLSERGIPNVVDPRTWNPNAYAEARLTGFYGEAHFAAAVARVSTGEAPRVYVSTGHGEPAIDGTLATSLGRLRGELERDGFRVRTWDSSAGPIPADASVVCILGPRQPLASQEESYVADYLARGGRVVIAPGNEAPGAVHGLLAANGIKLQDGIVCEEIRDQRGGLVEGLPYCAVLKVDGRTMAADHPVTELMRSNGLKLELSNTFSFARGEVPLGARVRDLVRSSPEAWRDLRDPRTGAYNYALDQTRGETKGAAGLVTLVELDAPAGVDGGRVLAVGSATFFADGLFGYNRDFLRAAFNWLAEREQRIDVAPRKEDTTRIDIERGREYGVLAWILTLVLPGMSALIGGVVAWRRRR